MEEQKYFKRKRKALASGNRLALAEACLAFGTHYKCIGRYDEAVEQLEESASVYARLGMKLESANATRAVAEVCLLSNDLDTALRRANTYLSVSRELHNVVEEQRALTTVGRVYLHQNDATSSKSSLQLAHKTFLQSLSLVESCQRDVKEHELMDMKARSLFNVALTAERLCDYEKTLECLQKAVNICKRHELYEQLHNCLTTEGEIYLKMNDHHKALNCFNLAFENASRLDNKVEKKCSILQLKADGLCSISDFQSAKMVLLKAWKMNNQSEKKTSDIEKKLKIVAALCYTEDLLVTTNSNDYKTLKSLYEKMGDGACALSNYQKAINYYLKMLENAEKNGDSDKELVPVYVSLHQTYKDLEDYAKAVEYSKKEYEIIKDNTKDGINSLLNIAELLQLAENFDEAEELLLKASEEAQRKYVKLEKRCLDSLLQHYEKYGPSDKLEQIKLKLSSTENLSSDEDSSEDNNTPNIGDDICIEDLTDFSDNEDSEEVALTRTARKRGRGFAIKKNAKGETQLHQACISGNLPLVTRLISQGHPVNVRDNAGWLPLHEACIHGHKPVVEFLIKSGANINDRGGAQCDGITPLYDAASNGHLYIIESLLDSGASPIIKTDFGETPLDALKKWYKRASLSSDEKDIYHAVCGRIKKVLNTIGESSNTADSRKILTPSNSSDLRKSISQESLRRNIEKTDASTKIYEIEHNNLSEGTDSDNSSSSIVLTNRRLSNASDSKSKNNAVSQYKNAINIFRKKPLSDATLDHKDDDSKKRSALLDPNEVGDDDWLEDDIQATKKRKRHDSFPSPIKISPKDSYSGHSRRLPSSKSHSDVLINDEDSDDMFGDFHDSVTKNTSPLKSDRIEIDSTENPNKRRYSGLALKKQNFQTSLTKAGFSKHKTKNFGNSRNSSGSIEIDDKNDEEPDSTTEVTQTLSSSSSTNVERISSENFLNNKSFLRTCSTVKVKVQDKLLLIPLPMDQIEMHTVKWLADEAARRYYNIEGVQPLLQLQTNDGAILVNDDPLRIVLNSDELKATIISWNLPSMVDRYVECCNLNNESVDGYIKMQLEASQATHVLQLDDICLSASDVKSIFKALNHQSNLKSLVLSNSNIGKDGLKLLAQCLPTMSNICNLSLSCNCIDWDGLRHLLLVFENSSSTFCKYLNSLDLSHNPINELGFKYVAKLTKFLNIMNLNLRACDIICESNLIFDEFKLNNLEILDLSYNNFSKSNVHEFLKNVTNERLSRIELEGIKLSGGLSYLFDSASYSNLKIINFSRCGLLDLDIADLVRSISKCCNLRNINLSYNVELTFTSLKKIIDFGYFTHVNFEGCPKILNFAEISGFNRDFFPDGEIKVEEIILTIEKSQQVDQHGVIENLSVLWQNYHNQKALLHRTKYGRLVFKIR